MDIDKTIKEMPATPLADRVIILPIKKEQESSIVIPEGMGEERKPREGFVVAVGKDVKELKLKDRVIYKYFQPQDVEIKGEKCLIAKEEDIFLKL